MLIELVAQSLHCLGMLTELEQGPRNRRSRRILSGKTKGLHLIDDKILVLFGQGILANGQRQNMLSAVTNGDPKWLGFPSRI